MIHEFYPYPGEKIPVKINGKDRGFLLKLVFELDCEYPLNHKYLVPDLINRPVEIVIKRGNGELVEPERLARYQEEGFRLLYVKCTDKDDNKWVNEIYYKWKWIPDNKRLEDNLDLSERL